MAITASDVNKLRQQTGAGMMDCKNALVEADGDFEAAVDILRKKGQKIAAKRGGNEAKEGIIIAQTNEDCTSGVILALNCETDFVAKNDGYVSFVQSLVNIALKNLPETADSLKALPFDERLSVEEKIDSLESKIDKILSLIGSEEKPEGEVEIIDDEECKRRLELAYKNDICNFYFFKFLSMEAVLYRHFSIE